MIVIAYDGSDDARAAIEQAGRLFPGQQATVVTVWQRFIDTVAHIGGGVGMVVDYDEIDASAEKNAAEQATEGVGLAKAAGLEAVEKTATVELGVAEAILDVAAEVGATVVVLGTRGFTGIKSLMMGSVSHHVLHHADRPVLIVPSPEVAHARAEHRASLG